MDPLLQLCKLKSAPCFPECQDSFLAHYFYNSTFLIMPFQWIKYGSPVIKLWVNLCNISKPPFWEAFLWSLASIYDLNILDIYLHVGVTFYCTSISRDTHNTFGNLILPQLNSLFVLFGAYSSVIPIKTPLVTC